jgi:hypothetical protein
MNGFSKLIDDAYLDDVYETYSFLEQQAEEHGLSDLVEEIEEMQEMEAFFRETDDEFESEEKTLEYLEENLEELPDEVRERVEKLIDQLSEEEDSADYRYVSENPEKFEALFSVIACGASSAIAVVFFLIMINKKGEPVQDFGMQSDLVIHWNDLPEYFENYDIDRETKLEDSSEEETDLAVDAIFNDVVDFFEYELSGFGLTKAIFRAPDSIKLDFEKTDIKETSGLNKEWRLKFGQKLIDKIEKEVTSKGHVFEKVEITIEELYQENEHSESDLK